MNADTKLSRRIIMIDCLQYNPPELSDLDFPVPIAILLGQGGVRSTHVLVAKNQWLSSILFSPSTILCLINGYLRLKTPPWLLNEFRMESLPLLSLIQELHMFSAR